MDRRRVHLRNVPGPFYVVDGCCTSCGVPELAGENFEFGPDGHCYVKRQPATAEELERVLRVVRTQELGCIRYGGSETTILRRLAEAGEAPQCDAPLTPAVDPIHRNHVTFGVESSDVLPRAILEQLRTELLRELGGRGRSTELEVGVEGAVRFSIAWFEDDFHEIEFRPLGGREFHLRHTGPLGLSEMLDDCLRRTQRDGIRWSTSTSGANTAPRPW